MKFVSYICCCILLMMSCRPAKKVQRIENAISKKDTTQSVIHPEEKVDTLAIVKDILDSVVVNEIDFNTFSGKIRLDYQTSNSSDQATAYVRMQKDSLIWLSLTGAFGIEGYRMLVTKDSVILMNKLDKTVEYRSINYLQQIAQVPLSFNDLQNIIIGNPVFIDTNIVSYKFNENEVMLSMAGNIFKNLLTISRNNYLITHSKLDDVNPNKNRTADITLTDYEKQNDFYFSTTREISVSEKSKLDIKLNFKQYNFNQPLTFPFNIPKNYKRG